MSVPASVVIHSNSTAKRYRDSQYPEANHPPFYCQPYNSGYAAGNGYAPQTYPQTTGYPPGPPPQTTYTTYPPPATYGAPAYYPGTAQYSDSYGKPHSYPQNYNPYGNGEKIAWNSCNAPVPSAQVPISYDTPNSEMISGDTSVSIRHAFVKKVYLILTAQLLYTFGFALPFTLVKGMRLWIIKFWWVPLIFVVIGFVLIIVITCCQDIARTFPTNFIILFVITISMAWLIALSGALTSSVSFAIAAGITAAVCVSLTIFAIQTKYDFTGWGIFGFVLGIVLLMFGLLAVIIRSKILSIVYAALGAAAFSFYLVYDTQQIVGGKHRKYQYSIDDYIMAALTLYMDVINLFLFMMELVDMAAK